MLKETSFATGKNGVSNALPRCPRCIGGRLVIERLERKAVCPNCGHRQSCPASKIDYIVEKYKERQ